MIDTLDSRFNGGICQNPEPAFNAVENERACRQIAAFMNQHRDELSRFIVRKLGSDEMSADILQDAFLRLSSRQNREVITNPRAFVFRIVANLVIDYQRLSANRLAQDIDDETLQAIPENLPGPDLTYQHRQRLETIYNAMEELAEDCRMVFYLNRVEGYSYAEVAERMQMSEGMVSKHLARAMKHCRDRLRHY